MKQVIVIETSRDAYSIPQILKRRHIMTAADLRAYLDEYDDDTPVVLSFDDGYTYGSIEEQFIRPEEVEEEDD